MINFFGNFERKNLPSSESLFSLSLYLYWIGGGASSSSSISLCSTRLSGAILTSDGGGSTSLKRHSFSGGGSSSLTGAGATDLWIAKIETLLSAMLSKLSLQFAVVSIVYLTVAELAPYSKSVRSRVREFSTPVPRLMARTKTFSWKVP